MLSIIRQVGFFKKTVIIFVLFLFFLFIISRGPSYDEGEVKYGLTFSKKQAVDLGLNWKVIFTSILDDLKARNLRLPAYWDEIEREKNDFYWTDLDWQVDEAGKRDAQVILSVGSRLPRWPECHLPQWAANLSKEERENEVSDYIKKVVERYRDKKQIVSWQVENEPFLSHFGECPKLDIDFLDKEIALVKSLDSRPVVVTDSGELSWWVPAAKRADIFGTTMYKRTYSSFLKSYIKYPIGPAFFRAKRNLVSLLAHPQKWIVIELQAEPWGPVPFQKLSAQDRQKTMDVEKMGEMVKLARESGFSEVYLWGVEWWYWEMVENDDLELLQTAKDLFVDSLK